MEPYQTLLHPEQSDLHSLSMRLLKHSQRRQMQIFFVGIAALMLKCLYCDLRGLSKKFVEFLYSFFI